MRTRKRQWNEDLPPESDEGAACHVQLPTTGYPIKWLVSGDQGNGSLTMSEPNEIAPLADRFRWSGAGVYLKLTQEQYGRLRSLQSEPNFQGMDL
jgi:hypothetical protein